MDAARLDAASDIRPACLWGAARPWDGCQYNNYYYNYKSCHYNQYEEGHIVIQNVQNAFEVTQNVQNAFRESWGLEVRPPQQDQTRPEWKNMLDHDKTRQAGPDKAKPGQCQWKVGSIRLLNWWHWVLFISLVLYSRMLNSSPSSSSPLSASVGLMFDACNLPDGSAASCLTSEMPLAHT